MFPNRRQFLKSSSLLAAGSALSGCATLDTSGGYDDWDATQMASLVRAGHITPTELLNEALTRMQRWNPTLNACLLYTSDAADE